MTTTVIDDKTTAALRDAIAAASRGNLAGARTIAGQALKAGGNVAALNAFLGMACQRMDDQDAAISHYRAAHLAQPADHRIRINLASALAEKQANQEAANLLTDEVAAADATRQVDRLRGYLFQSLGEYDRSVAAYEKVVEAFPNDWEAWNNLGNARRCAHDFDGAVKALETAAKLAPDVPPVLLNHAVSVGAAGDLAKSERLLKDLATKYPDEIQPLSELHSLYKEQSRDEEALEMIERAVAIRPDDVELLLALASHLSQVQKHERSREVYGRVIAVQPENGPANLGTAISYELTNRVDELLAMADIAKQRGVNDNVVNFIHAFACRRRKDYQEGLEAIEKVPETMESPRRWHLYGQLLQGVDRYDEAMAAYQRMNDMAQDDPSEPYVRGERYRDLIRRQSYALTPELVASWRKEEQPDSRPTPAFLIGFPRSGTTLLDTMLMGHPALEVLEEEPTMREAGKHLPEVGTLARLGDDTIREARDVYWRIAADLTPLAPGKMLIDKNPLTMNGLPQVHRLFPDAKIILAMRHPCDVVLSCFLTNFRANDGMSSFLKLDTAAELYAISFDYLEKARELLKLNMHTVVYERVVADRATELQGLFDFLGIDWHDDVLDHETIAKGRGRIKTASYSQVTEPIYTRAAGRWWNYRDHLAPIFPVLKPWVERYGYSLDDPTVVPQRG